VPSQKIKVSRLALIQSVKEKLRKEELEYAPKLEQYLTDLKWYPTKLAAAHRAIADWVEAHADEVRDNDIPYKHQQNLPVHPSQTTHHYTDVDRHGYSTGRQPGPKPPNLSKHHKILRMLEMSTDETVSISIDSDFGEYL
jgi:hypothetical protein